MKKHNLLEKHNLIIIGITVAVGIMIIITTVMLIIIGNNFGSNDGSTDVSDRESETETSADSAIATENEYDSVEYVSSDKVDLDEDDTVIRDVKFENTYVNSVELLPSIRDQHEKVLKKNVGTDNFTRSFASTDTASVYILDDHNEYVASVSVPAAVTLYNDDAQGSGSFEINTQINGDYSKIKSIGWSSKDSSVIRLSQTSGSSVTVSRETEYVGSSSIEMIVTYYTGQGTTVSEAYDVSVNIVNMDDAQTCLYDKNGVKLYLDQDGTREAHLCDYASNDAFYGAIKTTGWQEINGNKYYYDYNSIPVTGIQYIGGTQYEFDENGVLMSDAGQKGIDVSLYQKTIDWQQVASSGISFAIIRCGFRGAVSGKLVEDSCFRKNIEGAKAAGLRVGVYFFTQALNEKEAVEEAELVAKLCEDYSLELPVFIDSEDAVNGRANGLDKTSRTEITDIFCSKIAEYGYIPGVYASKYWYYDKLDASQLEKYVIWVAQYNNVCDYKGKKDYWQYSSKEHISGIEGNVDTNMAY